MSTYNILSVIITDYTDIIFHKLYEIVQTKMCTSVYYNDSQSLNKYNRIYKTEHLSMKK